MAPSEERTVTEDRELYAVYDKTIGQFVSGVGSQKDADDARAQLGKTGTTKGHKLETRRV